MNLLLEVLCVILFIQTVGFIVSIFLGRNSIADVLWGFSIAVGALYIIWDMLMGFVGSALPAWLLLLNPYSLTGILIAIWGGRLTLHIGWRFIKKNKEDPRYAAMSQNWSNYYLRSYLQVFLFQGLLMVIMLSGLIALGTRSIDVNLISLAIGAAVWLFGFMFEIVGDAQLSRFVKTKKPGEIMTHGLWRYTRHPNYFGEVTLWWGLWIMTIPSSYWYLTIIPALTITFLILKVSGVPMAEARYKDNAAFQNYAQRTNKFFPWWPK